MKPQYESMVNVVSPGKSGLARIDHVIVTLHDSAVAAMRGEHLRPGALARLFVGGTLMMSDGAEEHRSCRDVVSHANGDVLIAGLGIGMVLMPILAKREVRSVTVIEKYQDVISLVEPAIRKKAKDAERTSRFAVINADIFSWQPAKGLVWDTIYFDIWPFITQDNLPEIAQLKRKFQRRLNRKNPNAWMKAWQEDYLRYARARDRRQEVVWR